MNKEIFKGDWNILKGKVKEKWGKLTDDDLTTIKGKKDQLIGTLQKRYGYQKEMAEKEVSSWEEECDKGCGCSSKDKHDTSKHTH